MVIKYGGFWRRLAAGIVDCLLIYMVLGVLGFIFGFAHFTDHDGQFAYKAAGWGALSIIILPWLYYALFHCSKYQATLGMLLFRMKIYTYDGERICFGRATGRYLAASFLSGGLTFGIGYLMIAFTHRKQALHDFIAHTLVVVTPSPSITIEHALRRADR